MIARDCNEGQKMLLENNSAGKMGTSNPRPRASADKGLWVRLHPKAAPGKSGRFMDGNPGMRNSRQGVAWHFMPLKSLAKHPGPALGPLLSSVRLYKWTIKKL